MKFQFDVSVMLSGKIDVEVLDEENVSFIPHDDMMFHVHPRATGEVPPATLAATAAKVLPRALYLLLLTATNKQQQFASEDSALVAVAPVKDDEDDPSSLN